VVLQEGNDIVIILYHDDPVFSIVYSYAGYLLIAGFILLSIYRGSISICYFSIVSSIIAILDVLAYALLLASVYVGFLR